MTKQARFSFRAKATKAIWGNNAKIFYFSAFSRESREVLQNRLLCGIEKIKKIGYARFHTLLLEYCKTKQFWGKTNGQKTSYNSGHFLRGTMLADRCIADYQRMRNRNCDFAVKRAFKPHGTRLFWLDFHRFDGRYADQIHNMVAAPSFKLLPSKGEYYLLDKNQAGLVKHVVFQCPDKNGKGTLVAPTAGGNIIVGPNAAASAKEDVSVTQEGLDYVAAQAKKSVPSLDVRSSIRNFAGMRANNDRGDFIIEEAADAPGFIDLAGIKSPGLTSAPAIGERCLMLLEHSGLALQEKSEYCKTRTRVKFNELSVKEKQEIISKNPLYGRIICRCETVTEGEIIDALRSPVPPVSIDGIKRRCGAGMGRCQGGFCSPRVMEILMNERHVSWKDIIQDKAGSYMLTGRTKTQESL